MGYAADVKLCIQFSQTCGLNAQLFFVLDKIPERLEDYETTLANLLQQQEAAKSEINKPFQYEEELRVKSARLTELDAELNIGGVSGSESAA